MALNQLDRTDGAKAQQQLDWIIKDFVSMPQALESGRLRGLVGMVLHGELTIAPRDWAGFQADAPVPTHSAQEAIRMARCGREFCFRLKMLW